MDGGGGVAFAEGAVSRDRHSGQFVATSDLTELQGRFVLEYVRNGGQAGKAATTAGYRDGANAAFANMRNPAILAAIRDEQARTLYAEVGSASVATVLSVMRDQGARNADKIQAARLGAEMAKLIKRDKTDNNLLNSKAFSEMNMEELETFIAAGNAAISARPTVETLDNAQDSAQVIERDPTSD